MKNLKYIWLRLLGYKPYVIEIIDCEKWVNEIQYLGKNGDRWVYRWYTPSNITGWLFTNSFKGRVTNTQRVKDFYNVKELRSVLVPENILMQHPRYDGIPSYIHPVIEDVNRRREDMIG